MGNEGSYVALGLKTWNAQIERGTSFLQASRPRRFSGK